MKTNNLSNLWAVVLAAGRGSRMNATSKNKVTYEISGKPMILRIVENIEKVGIEHIMIVVGHARNSVERLFEGRSINFVVQIKRLGTGHALLQAYKKLPELCKDVFVCYGDDTSYDPQILLNLYEVHKKNNADVSFLTVEVDNPTGLGRIIRSQGKAVAIVEEKNATSAQKQIKEINTGCFIFSKEFLKKYIKKITKNSISGEYYLTDLIELGFKNKEKVEAHKGIGVVWRGVNTVEELQEAEKMLQQ